MPATDSRNRLSALVRRLFGLTKSRKAPPPQRTDGEFEALARRQTGLSEEAAQRLSEIVVALDHQQRAFGQGLDAVIAGLDNQQHTLAEGLGAVIAGLDNQQKVGNEKLSAIIAALDSLQGINDTKLSALVSGLDNQQRMLGEKLDVIVKVLADQLALANERLVVVENRAARLIAEQDGQRNRSSSDHAVAVRSRTRLTICHSGHDHDRTYTENLVDFFRTRQVECKVIEMSESGRRPELQQCLDERPDLILGFNLQLDHSWLPTGSFLAAASKLDVPIVQWIFDHPSVRWPEFSNSASDNTRYLFNTRFSQQYFQRYCMPQARSAIVGGPGPSKRSRIDPDALGSFASRPTKCLIPLSLDGVGRTAALTEEAIAGLEAPVRAAVKNACTAALHDLMKPLDVHLAAALDERHHPVSDEAFNSCFHLLHDWVQITRRRKIFEIAREFSVLVQSDEAAAPYFTDSVAAYEQNVPQGLTLSRMTSSRAVVSASPINDLVHDRTMNGLNAGCVNIIEDNLAHRGLFRHGKNALLFRYNDESLRECLELVCTQPDRACEIARAGIAMRDSVPFHYCAFHDIIELARR